MIEKYFIYYAIGAVVIYFIFWKFLPFLRKAKKIFSSIYINKKATENNEQYRKIALGALYSEQQAAYINSLTTGLGKSSIKKLLSKWWGIDNTAEAKESLSYLRDKGFRYYFETVMRAYQSTNREEQQAIIVSSFNENSEEDIQKAYQQLINLQETWQELTENNIVSTQEELVKYNNAGWDYGRLVFLSRLCFDAGYITESEAWSYIDKAYELAIQHFNSWQEYSKSYIIGRAMWGGTESANDGMIIIAEELLKKEKSPWVQMSFKK